MCVCVFRVREGVGVGECERVLAGDSDGWRQSGAGPPGLLLIQGFNNGCPQQEAFHWARLRQGAENDTLTYFISLLRLSLPCLLACSLTFSLPLSLSLSQSVPSLFLSLSLSVSFTPTQFAPALCPVMTGNGCTCHFSLTLMPCHHL